MEISTASAEWIVEGMFPRKSLILWAGADGTGKTYLAKKLAIEVALGGEFLGRPCGKDDVLYLDYENPDHEVRARQQKMAGGAVPGLRTWGVWLEQQPPAIGDPLLLRIADQSRAANRHRPFPIRALLGRERLRRR